MSRSPDLVAPSPLHLNNESKRFIQFNPGDTRVAQPDVFPILAVLHVSAVGLGFPITRSTDVLCVIFVITW
jgi:hypothetical protein